MLDTIVIFWCLPCDCSEVTKKKKKPLVGAFRSIILHSKFTSQASIVSNPFPHKSSPHSDQCLYRKSVWATINAYFVHCSWLTTKLNSKAAIASATTVEHLCRIKFYFHDDPTLRKDTSIPPVGPLATGLPSQTHSPPTQRNMNI